MSWISAVAVIALIALVIFWQWSIWDFQTKKIESGCIVATQNYMGQPTRYQNCESEWWEIALGLMQPSRG